MNKQEAWRYYKIWMKEKTYCKALRAEVRITRKGWDHLVFGNTKRRRKSKDKYSRFDLLKLAKYTIKNAEKFTLSVQHGQTYFVLEMNKKKYLIRVLIKKDGRSEYYFYSVMKH